MPKKSERPPIGTGRIGNVESLRQAREGAVPEDIPCSSLDDVAALLIQLNPSDVERLARLRDMLRDISSQEERQDSVRRSLSEACEAIEKVIAGSSPDGEELLGSAGRLIEEAMRASEASALPAFPPNTEPEPAELTPPENAGRTVATLLPADFDSGLLSDFVTESLEYIEKAEAALLCLETDPEDQEAVNTVFRAFHTIKGTSGFLEISAISDLAHKAESLLSRVREREILCAGGYADLALRSADMLKKLIQSVRDALGGESRGLPEGYEDLLNTLSNPEASGISSESSGQAQLHLRVGDILVAAGAASRKKVEAAVAAQGDEPIGIALLKSKAASLPHIAEAIRVQQRLSGDEKTLDSSVRVRTDRLDRLIDMIGELVIAQSMIAQDRTVMEVEHHELAKRVTHTGKIVRELHDLSMSMRMVPLKATFQKMARLVRDLSRKSGKQVSFETDGEDTEIDRNMVDVIADPLVHMVRNAVDHGIELPEERKRRGKPEVGKVRLAAYHSGGNVVVEMSDDGRGLDRDKIIEKALAKGIIESDKGLSESDVFNLIFAPGFSTADKVTEISGRGVGMDVVMKNVEALRGHVDIESEFGKGCIFKVRLPLTLAITDGMLVKVGQERYIIPTVNIHLSFRPEAAALSTIAGRGQMVMLRNELMPVYRLYRLFEVSGATEDPLAGLLVVVGDGCTRCALLVDELLGQQQVVAKALGRGTGKLQGISGGAILGDGRVGLILDPSEIVALARQTSEMRRSGGTAPVSEGVVH